MIIKLSLNNLDLAREIIQIQKQAYQVEADLISFQDLPPLKEKDIDLLNSSETYQGYILDKKIVGVIAFEVIEDYLEITKLFVLPDYFKKNIGSILLNSLSDFTFGLNFIKVQTGLKNFPAISLYEKYGFKVVKISKPLTDNNLEVVELRKNLKFN